MKKVIYLFVVATSVLSCQRVKENESNLVSQKLIKNVQEPHLEEIEGSVTFLFNRDSVNLFLENPFDLYEFKQKKNGSLSGGVSFQSFHFRPDFGGIGYRFFMFDPKNSNIVYEGRNLRHSKAGYIGTNKRNLSFKEDGLIIKSFQPNDKFKNKYLNPNEILIEVVAKFNDFDLPELAFVGLDFIKEEAIFDI